MIKITKAAAIGAAAGVLFTALVGAGAWFLFLRQAVRVKIGLVELEEVFRAYQSTPTFQAFQSESADLQALFQKAAAGGDEKEMTVLRDRYIALHEKLNAEFESEIKRASEDLGRKNSVKLVVPEVIYNGPRTETVDVTREIIAFVAPREEPEQPAGETGPDTGAVYLPDVPGVRRE